MASTVPLLTAISDRCTLYDLSPSSPIPDSRIHEIVNHIVKHCPNAFNQQSARCVVLLKEHQFRFWDICKEVVTATMPEHTHAFFFPKLAEYRNAYGTVLFYEDPTSVKELQAQRPAIAHLFPQWSEHSTGMHQYALWCALQAEGLGCNLQHYEGMEARASAEWNHPIEWLMKAQLVFGAPTKGRRFQKAFKPLEDRVFVHGA